MDQAARQARKKSPTRPARTPLTPERALARFRAGRVVIETTPNGARRSWNPDRQLRTALGITSGRQWRKYRKAQRLAARRGT